MSDSAKRRLFAIVFALSLIVTVAFVNAWFANLTLFISVNLKLPTSLAWLALAIFVLAYILVVTEEITGLRKSKPLVVAAGIIWLIVAIAWSRASISGVAEALRHNLLEYAELLLFLLAAMSYVNTMEERRVFDALRARLIAVGCPTAARSGSPGCSPSAFHRSSTI